MVGTKWDIFSEDDSVTYLYKFTSDSEFFVSGGEAGEGMTGTYTQVADEVTFQIGGFSWGGTYDGTELKVGEGGSPNYPGFYPQEIKRITMLGSNEELEWVMTSQGLIIKTPEKIGDYAYSFKIERYHHPKL